ncbi:hypothetical protein Patl1_36611 [Pistacia atlantica]|nr:hypothetical protein Patl1_36611 [Pistacia atlantica]
MVSNGEIEVSYIPSKEQVAGIFTKPSPNDHFEWMRNKLKVQQMIEFDAAMTKDLIAYNLIPLDAPIRVDVIVSFAEVRAAVLTLKYFPGLPRLPKELCIPPTRNPDMHDFLHCIFGFQVSKLIEVGRFCGSWFCLRLSVWVVVLP